MARRQILQTLTICLLVLAPVLTTPLEADSQPLEERVERLENKVNDLPETGLVLFLFGIFCALWAQNTQRAAWGWFFFGLFLGPVAAVVLLAKNSSDRRNRDQPESDSI